ncbi:preprotein translocase subunit SecG [compost metagenome]
MKPLKVIGWILVPFIMIFISWKSLNKNMRILGVAWAVLFLLIGFFNRDADSKTDTVNTVAKSETTEAKTSDQNNTKNEAKKAVEPVKEEQKQEVVATEKVEAVEDKTEIYQEIVLEFEKDMYTIEGEMKPYMDNYQNALAGIADGTVDIFTAYEATERAKDAAKKIQSKFHQMDIPKELPKDVKKELEGASSDLATAYYTKSEALKYVLKYFDDQKPSYMSKFQDEISVSDNFIMTGVLKVMKAKELVGLDLTEITE